MEENCPVAHFSHIVTENSSMLNGQNFLITNLSMCMNMDLYSDVLMEYKDDCSLGFLLILLIILRSTFINSSNMCTNLADIFTEF